MRIAFIIIGALIFASFAVAVFERVLNFGNIAGMAAGAAYAAFGFLLERMHRDNRVMCCVIALCVLLLAVLRMREIYIAGKNTATDEKVIIVLGCRVKGSRPSLELKKRIDAAYTYLLRHPDSVAILSGGKGRDEEISEAQCMKNELTARGIFDNRLIIEDRSTSTDENIRFSAQIMLSRGLGTKAAVVTSQYHQMRAARICRAYNIEPSAVSSKTKITLLPTVLFREMFALLKPRR